jgi:hypothetical protein
MCTVSGFIITEPFNVVAIDRPTRRQMAFNKRRHYCHEGIRRDANQQARLPRPTLLLKWCGGWAMGVETSMTHLFG